jgi:hypothetical protein
MLMQVNWSNNYRYVWLGVFALSLVTVAVMAVFLLKDQIFSNQEYLKFNPTILSGLEPDSTVFVEIIYKNEYSGSVIKEGHSVLSSVTTVGSDGRAVLPAMRPYYDSIYVRAGIERSPIELRFLNQIDRGQLGINVRGLEQFSDVVIETDHRIKRTKTDWAGLFSDALNISGISNLAENPQSFRLAFSGFSLNDSSTNPALLEVVIGVGGGPTDADVNVYNPRIHEYNCGRSLPSVDGQSIFRPSTCDAARMNQHIQGTGPGTVTYNIVQPLMKMTEQLSAVMMLQMKAIGGFFDAKEQMQTQRAFRTLVAEAHKDYHPSEQMCQFGSFIKDISHAESRANFSKKALNNTLHEYYRSKFHMSSTEGATTDVRARIEQFRSVYCNPNDFAGGLWELCRNAIPANPTGPPERRERYNKDVDFFRTLDKPVTLEIDLTNSAGSEDFEDVVALAKNLYWPNVPDLPSAVEYRRGFEDNYKHYLATRSVISKYNIAHASFAHIAGMKTQSAVGTVAADATGPARMKSLLQTFFDPPLADDEMNDLMGERPSYYAQMEFLTKRMFQHPTFYTNLYDKPANVDRINTTLEAFQLMHGRDRFESMLRQEMLISVLVEQQLEKHVRAVNAKILEISADRLPITSTGN